MGEAAAEDLARKSFEEALQELEEIVKSLEGGKGTLAQAIADYERGAALRAPLRSEAGRGRGEGAGDHGGRRPAPPCATSSEAAKR